MVRGRIEEAFGCSVRESMGIGDITLSAWAEDEDGKGMHFMPRGFVHVELIDPATGEPKAWEDGAEGELVYTAAARGHAAAALPQPRPRRRHDGRTTRPGRTGPRIRCVGRTDDMLIVRGVNLFPTAIRSLLDEFTPQVSGMLQVRPRERGVLQTPPLPVVIELGKDTPSAPEGLRQRIVDEIRARLLVTTDVSFVPYNTLPRETYKSKLVDYSDCHGCRRQRLGAPAQKDEPCPSFPCTIVGSLPQPEWLIDRAKLAGQFPPRTRAKELWRVDRVSTSRRRSAMPRAWRSRRRKPRAWISSATVRSPRELLQPFRQCPGWHRPRQSGQGARSQR
jgi:hypothetical protein